MKVMKKKDFEKTEKDPLDAIKHQGQRQLDAIEKQGKMNLKVIEKREKQLKKSRIKKS